MEIGVLDKHLVDYVRGAPHIESLCGLMPGCFPHPRKGGCNPHGEYFSLELIRESEMDKARLSWRFAWQTLSDQKVLDFPTLGSPIVLIR